jgi:hypothetical protein
MTMIYCAMQAPGPGGGARASWLSTGAAATPRRLRRQRILFMRARSMARRSSPVLLLPLLRAETGGDQRASAMVARRGQMVGWMLLASTCSPHIAPPPPITNRHCASLRPSHISISQRSCHDSSMLSRYHVGSTIHTTLYPADCNRPM